MKGRSEMSEGIFKQLSVNAYSWTLSPPWLSFETGPNYFRKGRPARGLLLMKVINWTD